MLSQTSRKIQAFSLIQLSAIVLAGGLVAAAMLPEPDGVSQSSRYMTTIKHMNKIDDAMLRRMMALEGRRPCPASGAYYPGHAQFGREDGSPGDCADSGATDGLLAPFNDANVVGGTVPVMDLHLDFKYYFDGWGRPFTYVVDKRATDPLACVQIAGGGDVRIDNAAGADSDSTMYAIISHGPDGHGSFVSGGGTRANRMSTGSTDADQLKNAGAMGFTGFDIGGSNPAAFINRFVSRETSTTYDDVTHYNERFKNTCCVGAKCSQSIAALPDPRPEIAGLVINGKHATANAGHTLSAGDINSDGYEDIIVTAPWSPHPYYQSMYVVFGKASGYDYTIEASDLDGTNGFIIELFNLQVMGESHTVGDVNDDGYDDLIVGAYQADPGGRTDAGTVYIIFGKAPEDPWSATFDSTDINGTDGVAINGILAGDAVGTSVALGDINSDTILDLIIGAPNADSTSPALTDSGETYVVFGKSSWPTTTELSAAATLNGTNGFKMISPDSNSGYGGYRVASGDINCDGIDDVVTSSTGDNIAGTRIGRTYVLFGKADWSSDSTFDLRTVNGITGFDIRGPANWGYFGRGLATGNINGDSDSGNACDDIVVASSIRAANGNANSGETYVLFGKPDWSSDSVVSISSVDGTIGFSLRGEAVQDISGESLAVGNFNNDAFDDILVTAYGNDESASTAGAGYLVFGRASWTGSSYTNLSALNGANGFKLLCRDADDSCGKKDGAGFGDMNGDGYDDILLGAKDADPNGLGQAGEAYVIFGNSTAMDGSASYNVEDLVTAP